MGLEVPDVWAHEHTVCNLLEPSKCCDCVSVADFAKQFKHNSDRWTADGKPRIWAPPHAFRPDTLLDAKDLRKVKPEKWAFLVGVALVFCGACICCCSVCKTSTPERGRPAEMLPLASERSETSMSAFSALDMEAIEDDPQIACRIRPGCCGLGTASSVKF